MGDYMNIENIGKVVSISDSIVKVIGLENAFIDEIIHFASGCRGVVMSIDLDIVYVVAIDDFSSVREGDIAKRSNKICSGPYGMGVLGRVLNGLGDPIDGKGPLHGVEYKSIQQNAPVIMDRESISNPFYTGVLAIDSCISIGKGQRELLIGDRQTGKTTLALQMILNQLHNKKPMYCIYVAIGQKLSSVAQICHDLALAGAMDYSVVISATAAVSSIEQFLAPYLGCLIGEYFRDNGQDALIIYDDLSKHAIAYRELSLLLKRPPGREAYPGDIFYMHSKLLERAGQMSQEKGGGSLTAIPIVQTQEGNVSAYIPTNVISITDGQIFLSQKKLLSGVNPPIDIPLSVSRVGSSAQEKLMKKLSGGLKSKIAQYEELQEFVKFSSSVDAATQKFLDDGKILELIFQQDKSMNFVEMVVTLSAYKLSFFRYFFDECKKNNIVLYPTDYGDFVRNFVSSNKEIANLIENRSIGDDFENIIKINFANFAEGYVKSFVNRG